MYVFVQVAELAGPEKQVALGQVEDGISLKTLLERTLTKIDKYLPEADRNASRHFWHNDRLLPFERAYLSDVATAVNVTLELRLDTYKVQLPGSEPAHYAVDPEMTVADAIDQLMDRPGASSRYQLLPYQGTPLRPSATLLQQNALPYHARLSQEDMQLRVQRKPQIVQWVLLALAALLLAGVAFGYLSTHNHENQHKATSTTHSQNGKP